MKEIETSAKTVNLAIEDALSELKTTRDKVDVAILSQGGLFAKAKVRVTLKPSHGSSCKEFVDRLLSLMGIEAATELIDEDGAEPVLNIVSLDAARVVGHKGEVIDALQYLTTLVSLRDNPEYKRVTLDAEGYRARKQERLERLAINMAQKAVKLGNRIKLDSMTSYERRVIHAALADSPDVTTSSEGDEPFRYVVITPNRLKSFTSRDGYAPRQGGYQNRNYGSGQGGYQYRNNYGDRQGGYQNRNYGDGQGGYENRNSNDGQQGGGQGGYQNRNYGDRQGGYGDRQGGYQNRNNYGDRQGGYQNRNNYGDRQGGYQNRNYGDRQGYENRNPAEGQQNEQSGRPEGERTNDGYNRPYSPRPAAPKRSGFSAGSLIKKNPYEDKE